MELGLSVLLCPEAKILLDKVIFHIVSQHEGINKHEVAPKTQLELRLEAALKQLRHKKELAPTIGLRLLTRLPPSCRFRAGLAL